MATLQSLEKKIDNLTTMVGGNTNDIKSVSSSQNRLSTTVGTLSSTVNTLSIKVDTLSSNLESLAIMTKEGFERCATKEQLQNVVDRFEKRFDEVDYRFDRIENISVGGHERRIENLEDNVRVIKTKLKLK